MRIDAVGFGLGHTLISYGDTPLSWAGLYPQALARVAESCGRVLDDVQVQSATAVLRHYNTRVTPRLSEVSSDEVIGRVLEACGLSPALHSKGATEAFFSFLQERSAPYDDAVPTLRRLRSAGLKVGVLTDVPYGMPREMVERDAGPLMALVDALVTSVEAGWRKPKPAGYRLLAQRLETVPDRMLYVGDEEKDITGAREVGMVSVLLSRAGTDHHWGQDFRVSCLPDVYELIETLRSGALASRRDAPYSWG